MAFPGCEIEGEKKKKMSAKRKRRDETKRREEREGTHVKTLRASSRALQRNEEGRKSQREAIDKS